MININRKITNTRVALLALAVSAISGSASATEVINQDFTADPGFVIPVAANNDYFTVGSDPMNTWVKSAANSGADSWAWSAVNGDIRMVQSTDDERYFAHFISEDRTTAGMGELRFNVSWSGTALAEVFVFTLDALLGDGEQFDIRGPDIELTIPAGSVLAGHLQLISSPGVVTQKISSINIGENDRIMLIFGVESANGDNAAFDNITLTGADPPVDPDDTDGDGLNDVWELDNFGDLSQDGGGDFDDDHFSNATEQDLGTDPDDPESTPGLNLHVSIDAASKPRINFLRFSEYGRAYDLLTSTNLTDWSHHLQQVAPLPALDSGKGYETMSFENLPIDGLERAFFKVDVEVASTNWKPNIVILYTDDMGYGDARCLNPDAKFATPNIDRLATEGISFTDGHCSDTVCTPSRYGLLTGRYCWRTTLKGGVIGAERDTGMIADNRMTIASLLRDNGYKTAMVGKWHLGMDIPGNTGNRNFSQPISDMPLDKGFDYFYGVPASMNFGYLAWIEGRFTAVNPTLWTQKKNNTLPGAFDDYRITPPYASANTDGNNLEVASDFDDILCLTRFTDKALAWMDNNVSTNGPPFFLYLPFTSSHKPVIPRADFQGLSEAGAYGDFMMETDYHIGRILDFLDDPDGDGDDSDSIAGNTLVFLSSDNGPESTYTQRVSTYGHDSAGSFRGGKRDIWEGGHRVPFIIRWPEVIPAGGQWNKPVCQTDLLATLAEMLGVRLPDNAGEDSDSFFKVLLDANTENERLPLIHHASDGQFAIRQGKWKLVMEHESSPRQLYDLDADPAETTDLLASHPEIVARLEARITAIVQTGRTRLGGSVSNDGATWWSDLTWIPQP